MFYLFRKDPLVRAKDSGALRGREFECLVAEDGGRVAAEGECRHTTEHSVGVKEFNALQHFGVRTGAERTRIIEEGQGKLAQSKGLVAASREHARALLASSCCQFRGCFQYRHLEPVKWLIGVSIATK
jgi:hypothetical protein